MKNFLIAACVVAMFGVVELGAVQTAEAAPPRVWRNRISRQVDRSFNQGYRSARQDFRQIDRRLDRGYYRGYQYGRYPYRNRGVNNGYIVTPYFGIAF